MTAAPQEQKRVYRRRGYDVVKHLTLAEAVSVCRDARTAVEEFDAMRDLPSEANVNSFTTTMARLRKTLLEPKP